MNIVEYCGIKRWQRQSILSTEFKYQSSRLFLTCEKDHSSFSYSLSQRATRLIKGKSRKEPQLVREMKLCNNGSRMAKMTIMQGHRRLLKSGPARYSHKSPSTERAQEEEFLLSEDGEGGDLPQVNFQIYTICRCNFIASCVRFFFCVRNFNQFRKGY